MNDRDIETLLSQLENGNISEDEANIDEDALDYNDNLNAIARRP